MAHPEEREEHYHKIFSVENTQDFLNAADPEHSEVGNYVNKILANPSAVSKEELHRMAVELEGTKSIASKFPQTNDREKAVVKRFHDVIDEWIKKLKEAEGGHHGGDSDHHSE